MQVNKNLVTNSVLIEVIIPSFNHVNYVQQAIESVLNQKAEDFLVNLIVIDDGSTDGSREKLEVLRKNYSFTLILNNNNLGLNASIDRALGLCNGNYVCLLASDDFLLPNKLARQYRYLAVSGDDCVYGRGHVVDDKGIFLTETNLKEFSDAIREKTAFEFMAVDDSCGPLLQSAMLKMDVARTVFAKRQGFKSDDWIVLLQLLKDWRVGYLDDPVFCYRIHSSNTHANSWKMLPIRLEVPCIYLQDEDVRLRNKALSNILTSHGFNQMRRGGLVDGIRFFLAGLCFGFPGRKIAKVLGRR